MGDTLYILIKRLYCIRAGSSEASISFDKQFENDTLNFRVHDMRNPIQGEKVDAVMNLFTSFGYFDRTMTMKRF